MRYDRNSPVPSILDLREVLCTATNVMVVVPNQQCGCGAKRIGQCSSDLTASVSRLGPRVLPSAVFPYRDTATMECRGIPAPDERKLEVTVSTEVYFATSSNFVLYNQLIRRVPPKLLSHATNVVLQYACADCLVSTCAVERGGGLVFAREPV